MFNTLSKPALIAAALLFSATAAFAHAEFVKSTPAPDSTVTSSPAEIEITFSEALNLKFSGAKLADSMKMDIATGPASLAKGGDTTLVIPVTKPLAAGEYVVAWHNLSKDGHKLKGSFKFTVKP
jgi:methionine-rich copper-binding protein CopC